MQPLVLRYDCGAVPRLLKRMTRRGGSSVYKTADNPRFADFLRLKNKPRKPQIFNCLTADSILTMDLTADLIADLTLDLTSDLTADLTSDLTLDLTTDFNLTINVHYITCLMTCLDKHATLVLN